MLEPMVQTPLWQQALLALAVLVLVAIGLRGLWRVLRGMNAERQRLREFRDEKSHGADSRFARERQAWVEAEAQLKQVLAAQGRTPTDPRT